MNQVQTTEKQFLISESLRAALIAYLSSRPFAEVKDGVIALENLKEADLKT